jgi:hypothetical protein
MKQRENSHTYESQSGLIRVIRHEVFVRFRRAHVSAEL